MGFNLCRLLWYCTLDRKAITDKDYCHTITNAICHLQNKLNNLHLSLQNVRQFHYLFLLTNVHSLEDYTYSTMLLYQMMMLFIDSPNFYRYLDYVEHLSISYIVGINGQVTLALYDACLVMKKCNQICLVILDNLILHAQIQTALNL